MLKIHISRDHLGTTFEGLIVRGAARIDHRSFIRLELLDVAPPPKSDWLFFLSPSGVRLFASAYDARGFKIGALWNGTAEAVERYLGTSPEFVGRSEDSEEALKEFIAVPGENETVTVAQSDKGLRRMRGLLEGERLREWTFYSNIPHPPDEPVDADYILFTSPSNAEAYLSKHALLPNQYALAIGETTRKSLQRLGYRDVLTAEEPSEAGMWEAVKRHRGVK